MSNRESGNRMYSKARAEDRAAKELCNSCPDLYAAGSLREEVPTPRFVTKIRGGQVEVTAEFLRVPLDCVPLIRTMRECSDYDFEAWARLRGIPQQGELPGLEEVSVVDYAEEWVS